RIHPELRCGWASAASRAPVLRLASGSPAKQDWFRGAQLRAGGDTDAVAGANPEERVAWPLILQRWQAVTFLHWSYDPAVVQRLLPPGLTVHTHCGLAWVGLAPFLLGNFRSPGVPALPWLSSFPETNVRTYVLDSSGRDGLWFLSLDAASLVTVAGARAGLWLPYHWAAMTVERDSKLIYRSCRRWPPTACHYIVVEPGLPMAPEALGERDHFLIGRWRAFTRIAGGRLADIPVEHQPWPLWSVHIHHLEEDLLVAAGLPAPQGEPVAHYSPGVDVRFGVPRWLG
ncbi:MAG: DUF2071 domain-containing protein, partial [Actinobacteria bacterium]|nr:DUF2071 domain-containing protein [Actinomycetota bacterium]